MPTEIRTTEGISGSPERFGLGRFRLGRTRLGQSVAQPAGSITSPVIQSNFGGIILDNSSAEIFSEDISSEG